MMCICYILLAYVDNSYVVSSLQLFQVRSSWASQKDLQTSTNRPTKPGMQTDSVQKVKLNGLCKAIFIAGRLMPDFLWESSRR